MMIPHDTDMTGALQPPRSDENAELWLRRHHYLAAVQRVQPKVLKSLKANVLPVFSFDDLLAWQRMHPQVCRVVASQAKAVDDAQAEWRSHLGDRPPRTGKKRKKSDCTTLAMIWQRWKPGDQHFPLLTGIAQTWLLNWAWIDVGLADRRYVKTPHTAAAMKLVEALESWAGGFNLLDSWIKTAALQTMSEWELVRRGVLTLLALDTEKPDDLRWHDQPNVLPTTAGGILAEDFPTLPRWEPVVETEEEYVAAVRDTFEVELGAYLARVKCELSKAGWSRVPRPRSRARPGDRLLHFEWLARYQVTGLTCQQIADRHGRSDERPTEEPVETSAVQRAIQRKASTLGLTLRSELKRRRA
jgi:hypothetical protein